MKKNTKQFLSGLLFLLMLLSYSEQAGAVTYSYTSGNPSLTSSWSPTPANFSGTSDVFRISGTSATLSNAWTVAGTVEIASGGALTVATGGSLTVKTLTNNQNITLNGGAIRFSGGGVYNGAGTSLNITNPSTITLDAGNTIFSQGVSLDGQVTFTIQTGATWTLDINCALNKLVNNGTIALNNRTLRFQSNGGTYTGTGSITSFVDATPEEIIVENNGALTLNNNLVVPASASFRVLGGGSLAFATTTTIVSGVGNFSIATNASINLNHINGLGKQTATIALGQIQCLGTRTYANGVNFTFSGASGQRTGADMPFFVRNFVSNLTGGGHLELQKATMEITNAFSQAANNTLQTNGCDVTFANGMATTTDITLRGGGFSTSSDKLIFNTSIVAGKTLAFSPAGVTNTLGGLKLDIGSGNALKLGSDIEFVNDGDPFQLELVSGKLDLNGNYIVLTNNAIMQEANFADGDVSNDAIVTDATATDQTNPGGYIEYNMPTFIDGDGFIGSPSFDSQGMGLYIEDAADGTGDFVEVTLVRRYHYNAKSGSGAAYGIKRIFDITGTVPGSGGAILGITYADSDLATPVGAMNETNNIHLSRFVAGTGWQSFADGTTGVSFNSAINNILMTDIPGFSAWTMSGNAFVPLPITLLRFDAKRVNDTEVSLTWATASETNNRGFEVEQSNDGQTFQKVGFVDGNNNSNQIRNYSFLIANSKAAYYRLKQVDFDEKFSYSPIRFVGAGAHKGLLVSPNPTTSRVRLQFEQSASQEVLHLALYTAQGGLVWEGKGKLADLEAEINHQLPQQPNGLLYLRLRSQVGVFEQKLVRF
jgi:hypothetical protein